MNNQLSIIEYSYYFALNKGNKSFVVPWIFELDEKVDKDLLKKAVKEAIHYFPRYTAKPYITKDGDIILVDNNNDPIITDDNSNIYLGTRDSNNFLYRIIVEDNKITFSIGHSLGDGRGMLSFCENVLHYYYIYKGEDPKVTNYIYNSGDVERKENIMSLMESVDAKYDLTKEDEDNIKNEIFKSRSGQNEKFNLELDDSLFSSKKFYRERILFDKKAFLDVVHKYNATPITFFYMIFSQILIEKYDIKNKRISAGIAADMRKYLASKSQNNFGTLSFISYDPIWKELDIDQQILKVRERFDKFLDVKLLKFMCKFFATIGDTSIQKFNINNYDKLINELKNDYVGTAGGIFISNNGHIQFSDAINSHVLSFELINTPTKNDYEIDITTFKNKVAFDLTLNGEDQDLFVLLCDKLNSHNIDNKYVSRYLVETDHVNPLLFDRE